MGGVIPKPCLQCGDVTTNGNRCVQCQQKWEQKRNSQPRRKAYSNPVYRSIPIGGICHICGKAGADTRDHKIPLYKGGTNDPSNIAPAHRACNSGKGAK